MEYEKYSNGTAEHLEHTIKSTIGPFNKVQGGSVDPFGEVEKKDSGAINMNAAEAFNKKKLYIVETMGTDEAKKSNKGMKTEKGDHFNVSVENCDIDPFGTEEADNGGHSNRK